MIQSTVATLLQADKSSWQDKNLTR